MRRSPIKRKASLRIKEVDMCIQRWMLNCLCVGLLFSTPLEAQQSQWQNLDQIRSGTKIQVVEKSLKSISGKFVSISETELTLTVEGQPVVISRDRVYRVSISGKNRKRNMLIGLAIGAAAGVGAGAAANRVVGEAWVVPTMAAVYGGAGVGVGALCPSAKTVFKAELPKASRRTEGAESARVNTE
jgi:hypothetical protein